MRCIFLLLLVPACSFAQLGNVSSPHFGGFTPVTPGNSWNYYPGNHQPDYGSVHSPCPGGNMQVNTCQRQQQYLQQMGFVNTSVPQTKISQAHFDRQLSELHDILNEKETAPVRDSSAFEGERWLYDAGYIDENNSLAFAKDTFYENAYQRISEMLRKGECNFSKAVFLAENAQDHTLGYEKYKAELKKIARRCRNLARQQNYFKTDSTIVLSWAIMRYMVDSITYFNDKGAPYKKVNYTYDFDDVFGERNIDKMFVSKLMKKHNGNCHSLPYLYKCIAQELGIGSTAHLAYLPNHVYIRQYFDGKWWNCELTSAEYIDDYQLMASGYVFVPGVQSGIYMTPLDERQSVAACLMDLATYYQWKYGYDAFVIKCVQRAIANYPNCIQGWMMQANYWNLAARHYLKKAGLNDVSQAGQDKDASFCVSRLESIVKQMDKLGYNPVPKEVYEMWLNDMQREKMKREKQKYKMQSEK